MKRIIPFLLTAALLTVPALAAEDGADAACAHSFEAAVVTEATCAEKGLLAYTCAKCGLTYTAETMPTGQHDYALTDSTATCTQPGEDIYTCSVCGDTYAEAVPAVGHTPAEGGAPCTEGVICAVCGQEIAAPTGHSYAYQPGQQGEGADEPAPGLWRCVLCGRTVPASESGFPSVPGGAADISEAAADTPPAESAADPRTGLWIFVSLAVMTAVTVEAVLLTRSLGRQDRV